MEANQISLCMQTIIIIVGIPLLQNQHFYHGFFQNLNVLKMTNRILSSLLIIATFLITISCSNSENTTVKKNKSTVFDQKVDSIMQLMTYRKHEL